MAMRRKVEEKLIERAKDGRSDQRERRPEGGISRPTPIQGLRGKKWAFSSDRVWISRRKFTHSAYSEGVQVLSFWTAA